MTVSIRYAGIPCIGVAVGRSVGTSPDAGEIVISAAALSELKIGIPLDGIFNEKGSRLPARTVDEPGTGKVFSVEALPVRGDLVMNETLLTTGGVETSTRVILKNMFVDESGIEVFEQDYIGNAITYKIRLVDARKFLSARGVVNLSVNISFEGGGIDGATARKDGHPFTVSDCIKTIRGSLFGFNSVSSGSKEAGERIPLNLQAQNVYPKTALDAIAQKSGIVWALSVDGGLRAWIKGEGPVPHKSHCLDAGSPDFEAIAAQITGKMITKGDPFPIEAMKGAVMGFKGGREGGRLVQLPEASKFTIEHRKGLNLPYTPDDLVAVGKPIRTSIALPLEPVGVSTNGTVLPVAQALASWGISVDTALRLAMMTDTEVQESKSGASLTLDNAETKKDKTISESGNTRDPAFHGKSREQLIDELQAETDRGFDPFAPSGPGGGDAPKKTIIRPWKELTSEEKAYYSND